MGAPKQKWTDSEEAALKAGIEKYGPGKWRAIQKDPKFGPLLTQRSNVDLKDKWRNMSLNAEGVTTPREKTPKAQDKAKSPLAITANPHNKAEKALIAGGSSNALALVPVGGDHAGPSQAGSGDGISEAAAADAAALKKAALNPKYEEMILQAIAGLKEVEGSATASIAKFIEEKHAVPSNFRRILTIRLKSLVEEGKLLRQNQKYKIPEEGVVPTKKSVRKEMFAIEGVPVPPQEKAMDMSTKMGKLAKAKADVEQARSKMKTAEEAARAAALAVAEAEAAAAAAEQAAREAELAEQEAEAAEAMAEAAAAAVRPLKKRAKDKSNTEKAQADKALPSLTLMPPPPPPHHVPSSSPLPPSTSTSPGILPSSTLPGQSIGPLPAAVPTWQ